MIHTSVKLTQLYFCAVFTGCDEGVAALGEDLHEVVGQIPTSQVQTHDGVRQRVALIDGHVVGHTITRVQHNT